MNATAKWEERTDGGNHRFVLRLERYIYCVSQRGPYHNTPRWGLYVIPRTSAGMSWDIITTFDGPDLEHAEAFIEDDYPRRVVMEALSR